MMVVPTTVFNPDVQINAKIKHTEKRALIMLANAKGADGITALLRMLALAKEVKITL